MELSNLGPLKSAQLELSDLTLLIGENNTGKTFFATVLHRILAAGSSVPWRRRWHRREPPPQVREWIGLVLKGADTDQVSPDNETIKWAKELTVEVLEQLGESVRESISYAFGADPARLKRQIATRSAAHCYLKIKSSDPCWEIEVRFDSDKIIVTPPDPKSWLSDFLESDNTQQRIRMLSGSRFSRSEDQFDTLGIDFSRFGSEASYQLLQSWPRNAIHLPADRSGIMQSHNILASATARQAARAGIRPIEIDTLPGTSADFLSLVLEIPEREAYRRGRESPFVSLVEIFENDIRATIEIDSRSDGVDAVVATTPEGKFSMARASSMLSELAPLLLVLKSSGLFVDHLTIDEPEAHLHPEMQIKVASFLAELVNEGMGIILTTHSEFFVAQFNNMIRAYELIATANAVHASDLPAIDRSQVKSLRFTRENGWCVAREIELDRIDGIDESTFTDVMRSQYDKTAQLVNELLETS